MFNNIFGYKGFYVIIFGHKNMTCLELKWTRLYLNDLILAKKEDFSADRSCPLEQTTCLDHEKTCLREVGQRPT